MAVKSREEILESLRAITGKEHNDEIIGLVEDITDTFDELNARASDKTDWKQKYEDNESMWREKYLNRFYSTEVEDPAEDIILPPEPDKPKTFEDLFKQK